MTQTKALHALVFAFVLVIGSLAPGAYLGFAAWNLAFLFFSSCVTVAIAQNTLGCKIAEPVLW